MGYKGVIIEESLQNKAVLKKVKILDTKIEKITSEHKTPWLKQWTLHTVEIPEDSADEVASMLSHSFDSKHSVWYADFKNKNIHYIIYPNKIFKVNLGNPVIYRDARKYGISIGIPEYQVDFAPDDRVWER